MEKLEVRFKDVKDVSKFVHLVSKYDSDIDLYCGSYCVDAKSILGIMTMDLRNTMWITSNCKQSEKERLLEDLSGFAVA